MLKDHGTPWLVTYITKDGEKHVMIVFWSGDKPEIKDVAHELRKRLLPQDFLISDAHRHDPEDPTVRQLRLAGFVIVGIDQVPDQPH